MAKAESTSARIAGRLWMALLVIGTLTGTIAFGQAVSQISGTTRDMSGAVVPSVEVSVTQTDTGQKRTVMTDAEGSFVFPNLPIGPYRLEATKSGFKTFVQTGIELQVATSPVIPVLLGVGEVSQSVEVAANATSVDTQKLGVGTVVDNQRVLDLPLNGRNAADLVNMSPAVVQTGTSPVWSMKTGVYVSVAGGQPYGVYYSLDGAPHVNLYDATGLPVPFPDALQEFKVETSTQNASAGVHSGGAVTSVTKSGSNAFHGDAFEFLRNGAMNARNFFSATVDTLKRNQFGGTVGGPIKKDKIFFFGGFQGTELRSTPVNNTLFVPSVAMLQGDFTAFASAACQGSAKTLGAPFGTGGYATNTINPALFNAAAVKIAKYLPTTTDPCGRVLAGNPQSEYDWQLPIRVDYQLSDKQSIFVRYLATKQNVVIPYNLTNGNVLSTANVGTGINAVNGNGADDLAQSLNIGDTYVMSATMVNSFRLSGNRVTENRPGAKFFGPSNVGINAYDYLPQYFVMSVTGGPVIGCATCADLDMHSTYWTANDDVNLVKGSHQLAFGFSHTESLLNNHFNVRSPGNYNFTGLAPSSGGTGLGMSDFMVGVLSSFRQSSPNPLILWQKFFGLYAQDTWKVTSRLTVNYGIRWEPFFPQQIKNSSIYTFSLARFYQGTESTVYTNAPPGFYYPGDPGFNGKAGINKQWTDFQPRVGLAWDPTGDGKTAIRAGAGIAYDFVNQQLHHNTVCFSPFCGDLTLNGPIPLDNPWVNVPGGSAFPSCCPGHPPTGVFPLNSTYMPIDPNIKTPEIYNWNLGIQRQITPKWFASASYVGNQAIHMWTLTELNPGTFISGPCTLPSPGFSTPTRTFPDCTSTAALNYRRVLNLANPTAAESISNLTAYDSGATQSFNGLVLDTQWRASQGVTVVANYTWSHCIGDTTVGATVPNPGGNYDHLNNRALDRGNCVSDRRHIFNMTVVAQTPRFSNAMARRVGTGWTLSGLYKFTSGTPLTILTGQDRETTGTSTTIQRPNQVLNNTASPTQGQSCAIANCVSWLNPAAFALPAFGTYGNIGASNVLGPRFWQFDMALTRQFQIREGRHVELRGEAFNVLNGTRFQNPAVNLTSANTFGIINAAYDPRIMQVAVKFVF